MLWFKFLHFKSFSIFKDNLLLFIYLISSCNIMLNFSFFKIFLCLLLLPFKFSISCDLFQKFLIFFLLSRHFDFINFKSSLFAKNSFWLKINCWNFSILAVTHQNFSRWFYFNCSIFINCQFQCIFLGFFFF